MDMRFADTSRSDRALTRSDSSYNHRSEINHIEPNWRDAQRVARLTKWPECVTGAKKHMDRLRKTAVFKEIQTNINAEAGVRREDRLAQDEQKRARMRQMVQAQALIDGTLPEDEQTRSLTQLPPEDKKAYRVAQRRDAVLEMNPAYENISDEDLSTLTNCIENDVGMSKIILPQWEELKPSEEYNFPREALTWTSDAVEPNSDSRHESLQALFQDDSLVDSRLQLRSREAVEEPRLPSSTSASSQYGRTSRRRFLGRRTEVDINDNNAYGLSKGYELPEPIEDEFLRLPAAVKKNKDGLPHPCGREEQRRLARWEALREASAKRSALDQDMTLSNVRTEPIKRRDGTVIWSPSRLTPVIEQADTLSADHFGTHKRLGSEHATEDDSDKESSVRNSKRNRRSAHESRPSIKLRINLQKQHGRGLPKQTSDSSHPELQCSICGNAYADKNGLRRHTKNIHPDQTQDSQPNFSRSTSPAKQGRERCKFFGAGFASTSTLYRLQRDQHSERRAEFEHGRTRPSAAPVDTDLLRDGERSTVLLDRRDSVSTASLGGFKPMVLTHSAATGTKSRLRRSSSPFDTNLVPNRDRSTMLSDNDDDVSADSTMDDKPEAAAATTSSSATKPGTSVPSPRKRSAADSGDEKNERKTIVNTRNNSEI
ncbi:hypothetical protein AC579_5083 [Pseudocercospora musae]|uniref:C2H2-type domain-containing protein n=1 Tax=Pseudocercospora musae TaxID=113226 RepID=A0A139IN51_9PEZI|nr:hypothetical protein AC579_5083 [Pseudocercospora musae]